MTHTDILSVMSRKLAPFILLFGLYLVSYGHLSPGGGFQGGVVIASAFILLLLGRNSDRLPMESLPRMLGLIEAVSLCLFLGVGCAGFATGGHFLAPLSSSGPSGILAMNLAVGFKVGAGISLLCWYLLGESRACLDT